MIKTAIFDFDGVLVESVNVKTEAFRTLFLPYGEEVARKAVEYHLANGGISRFEKFRYYFQHYIGKPLSPEKERELGERFSRIVLDSVINCQYVKGARETLDALIGQVAMYVASGTPEDELRHIVKMRNMEAFFKGVYGAPATKTAIVRRILDENNTADREAVMIGDAMTDYEAATANGIRFIGRRTPGNGLFNGLNVTLLDDLTPLPSILLTAAGS